MSTTIRWHDDWEAARAAARTEQRPIFLFLYSPG
jgi:hypothetical protein